MNKARRNEIGAMLFRKEVKRRIEKSDAFNQLKDIVGKKRVSIKEQKSIVRSVAEKNFSVVADKLGINFKEFAEKNEIPEEDLREYFIELIADVLSVE